MVPSSQKWEKPPISLIKVNVDAAMAVGIMGFGVITQAWEGFVLDGCASIKGNHMSVEWAKLDALIKGITMACSYNFDKIIFESDCVSLVNHFRNNQEDITILGHKIKDTRGMLEIFISVEVHWIDRNRNKVADSLCNLALSNHCNLTFDMEYPSDIHDCIILDSL
ncbi:hypothetical protein Gogos_011686 [Gossypium gossypioides]|uniref:RNase H type-1 domain-containing protein n=1 Tax=Gossypium gossypioides TaxID=34282 RepID=A0A7J9BQ60_GOSGO|nr:hypothetical protein [Gossypium gossypioides]